MSAQTKPLMKFRLLAGGYVGPDYSQPIATEGPRKGKRPSKTVYARRASKPGETDEYPIVECENDLAALHGSDKFERIHEQPPVAAPQRIIVDIESMSFAELREYAEEQEIDLKGAKDKQESLKAIRAAKK